MLLNQAKMRKTELRLIVWSSDNFQFSHFMKKIDVKYTLYLSMRLSESEACLNCFYNNNIRVMKLFSFDLFEAKGP